MKKILVYCVIITAILGASLAISYADSNAVVEKPDIKININGTIGTYSNVPIIVNNRTLLPLRAILINLGVPNDDQHIIWNAKERSVTVNKDATKVFLKIDSNKAYANQNEFILDVAPIIYKDRTYIPVRFVSQSFGKKVVWDATPNMVLIRDESGFNEVKSVFDKVDTAMSSTEKYKTNEVTHTGLAVTIENTPVTVTSDRASAGEIDFKKNLSYSNMDATLTVNGKVTTSNLQVAIKNGIGYAKSSTDSTWSEKGISNEDFAKIFANTPSNETDILCAGLMVGNGANSNEIKLYGNVNFSSHLASLFKLEGVNQCALSGVYTEIIIDKNTNLVKKIYSKATGKTTVKTPNDTKLQVEISSTYADYNSNFEVAIPKDIA